MKTVEKGVLLLAVLGGVSSALGDLKVTMDINHPDRQTGGGYGGGVFWAHDASTGGDSLPDPEAAQFGTFCLETNEFFSHGQTSYVRISTQADAGGSGGDDPDPLDARTAFLYHTYRTNPAALNTGGLLFDGTSTQRKAATRALQEAIWKIEEETLGVNNALVTLATNAVNGGAWSGLGNVRVMQLWANANYTGNRQDQLILIPAPGALLLGLVGIGVLAKVNRNRRLAAA